MGKAGFVGTVSSHETKKLCVAFATKNEDLWIMRSQVALLGQLQAVCVLQASVRAGDKSFSRQMVLTVPGTAERFPMGSKHPTRPEWGCGPAGPATPRSTREDWGGLAAQERGSHRVSECSLQGGASRGGHSCLCPRRPLQTTAHTHNLPAHRWQRV